jgi:hypothetical protein
VIVVLETAGEDVRDIAARERCQRGEDVVRVPNPDETSVALDRGLSSPTLRNVFKGDSNTENDATCAMQVFMSRMLLDLESV